MKIISALLLTIPLPGAFQAPAPPRLAPAPITAAPVPVKAPPTPSPQQILEPLADMIGDAESDSVGGYNAANNGHPMDLGKDGLIKVFKRPASQVTVGEILLAQDRRQVHAVGRYQIIGSTLREIVSYRCISGAELFTPAVQDRAMRCLIEHKRPAVWKYLRTGHGITSAANSLALEWSSMPWTNGLSYYSGLDRAHATRAEVFKVLEIVRRNAEQNPGVFS